MTYIETVCNCGKIRGIENDECIEYRSVKYANSKRWEYPVQVEKWDSVYDATEYKDCSYQRRSFEDDAVCNAFYHKEFREGLTFNYSEDCLYLNIWSPKKPENCPVLIYIHGGSFTGGSSNEAHINGTEIAKGGVIFISFNYRLGPFGFCSHPDLTDENGVCGNYGLFDQYVAIKWIKDNIKEFGGNPDKITIMGQSAGAMSVDIHASSPLEKGWFSGAIMSSGAAMQRLLLKPLKPEKTVSFWEDIMKNAGVHSMEELRLVSPKTLYYAWLDACNKSILTMPYTFPVIDGKLLTKETFNMKNIADIPYIIGMTVTDMMPIVLMRTIKKWAKSSRKNSNKCYTYILSRLLPGDNLGAWHSSDLLYFFSTLKFNWRPFEKIDYEISNQMSQAIIAFSKNGNPNCSSLPHWESGTKKPMTFCENTRQEKWDVKTLIKNTFSKGKTE
ncbi:MAG: carboxylesterase family protein [Clostridiales bacterium]|nr:carboxylesterase family protein [Clostridiales bacterium]